MPRGRVCDRSAEWSTQRRVTSNNSGDNDDDEEPRLGNDEVHREEGSIQTTARTTRTTTNDASGNDEVHR
ncbi:unnamed protein product [Sphagnum balticum]